LLLVLAHFFHLGPDQPFQLINQISRKHMVTLFTIHVGKVVWRAAGQADVRLTRLARTVDQATDHRKVDRLGDILKPGLKLVHRGNHIEVLPRATRAGNDVHALLAQAKTLEDVEPDFHFLDRVSRQRNTNGVADAFHQQLAEGDGRLHRTGTERARLGYTEVQWLLDLLRQQAVG